MPVTIPELRLTVATAVLLLVHAPPDKVFDNVEVDPMHTFVLPDITAGNALTVTIATLAQPVGSVYDTLAVPADVPDTTPLVTLKPDMVPDPALHAPPATEALRVVAVPAHVPCVPVMAAAGLTVML